MIPATGLDPFRVHGGRVEAARAMFGGDDWIDLSTGIAPWAYPVRPDPAERLPDPAALADLEAAAGAAFGVAPGFSVVAVPGSDIALRLLAVVLGAARPAVVWPGYGGHRAAWPTGAAIAFDELEEAAGVHDLIVLASPGNPDGRVLSRSRAAVIAARTTLVVDEAYADRLPDEGDPVTARMIRLRSFGKFYGLPGLRLGFVIAPPAVAGPLRALIGDWPVSTGAIATGTAAYRDDAFCGAQIGRIAAAGGALDALLAEAGFAIIGSAPLFRLIACEDADALFRFLAGRAILTRPFADAHDRLRIGLPADTRAAVRLSTALLEVRR